MKIKSAGFIGATVFIAACVVWAWGVIYFDLGDSRWLANLPSEQRTHFDKIKGTLMDLNSQRRPWALIEFHDGRVMLTYRYDRGWGSRSVHVATRGELPDKGIFNNTRLPEIKRIVLPQDSNYIELGIKFLTQ